jgi:hypothetical protein
MPYNSESNEKKAGSHKIVVAVAGSLHVFGQLKELSTDPQSYESTAMERSLLSQFLRQRR